ncbi:MAG: TerB family tellurite resistance protein [Verrucomicrobia bacterium]|jgi:hypothetical protein|nr:TerB family tellurite resistance protein [Verrucomicrobiota bacterium]MBT7064693.1 TerB family tellurite resistance protein [Verrucomicrobiota bacterium]MBT7700185.1 TerB family tellurite resistance protein [Verrucomicrobiota bacterium]
MSKVVAKVNRPAYLANVLCIAKVGGEVAATESLVLRSIIHSIGGTRDDVAAAGDMLADGHYQLQVPEAPGERLANLQDMIMVALADGHISPMESAPIEKMAKAMGYAQADMDLAVQRAKNALKRVGRKPSAYTDESAPPPIPAPPPPPRPASKPVPKPVPIPKPKPEKKPPTPAVPPPTPVPDEAVAALAPDATTEDREAPTEQPSSAPMALPADVEACMKCRAASEHPETYCFGMPDGPMNPWGCRLSRMPWEPGAPWMGLGHFRDDAIFIFDKHAIAESLTAHLATVLSCPHLDTEFTEAAFDSLPERAHIGPRWQYRPADSADPDAVTVTTTHYLHGCAVSATLSVDGVDPIGTRDAMRIIRKAGQN